MRAGSLRDRVRIERAVDTTDAQGGTTRTWVPLDVVYAKIRAGVGREFVAAKEQIATNVFTVTIRHRDDITAGMRIRRGAAVLWVTSPAVDPDGSRERLTLLCEVRDGETGGQSA